MPSTTNILSSNPPRPQRQPLQLQRRRLNKPPKRNNTNNNTKDINDIIAIGIDPARAAALHTSVFLGLERAREGGGDEGGFEAGGRVGGGGRDAGGGGEEVDEFEDEEAWEGAAEVADTVIECVS